MVSSTLLPGLPGLFQVPETVVALIPYSTLVSWAELGCGAVKLTWMAPL